MSAAKLAVGMLCAADIDAAYVRIGTAVHRTPVFTSQSIDDMLGNSCRVFFKCENLQKTGSFKVRQLLEHQPTCTRVLTHSSGNHGAALAYAARAAAIACTVVMPRNAPRAKREALLAYGAHLVECEPTMADRQMTCDRIAAETGAHFVHPHNDYSVMAGQGTIALELLDQCPTLDAILVPLGGGGMASGIAAYVANKRPQCKVYVVEPAGKGTAKSLAAGRPLWPVEHPITLDTIADGMRVGNVADKCFNVLHAHAQHHVFAVNDEQIRRATNLIWQRLKLVIEPSSGTGVAALLSDDFRSVCADAKNVGVILCGGNVDATL